MEFGLNESSKKKLVRSRLTKLDMDRSCGNNGR